MKYNYDKLEHCYDCDKGVRAKTKLDECMVLPNRRKHCRSPYGVAKMYTDGIYLVSKDLDQLHKFADSLGLSSIFFSDKVFPRYRLPEITIKKAFQDGVIEISTKELMKMMTPIEIKKPT